MKKVLSMALSLTLLLTLFTFNTYAANYDYDDPGIEAGNYKTYPVIRKGDTGEIVKELQAILKYTFNYSISIDSSFGSETKSVVKKFQEKHKLSIDGVVGPNTWKKLFGE